MLLLHKENYLRQNLIIALSLVELESDAEPRNCVIRRTVSGVNAWGKRRNCNFRDHRQN